MLWGKLIKKELRKSYDFFIKEANTNQSSDGYGLIRDKTIFAQEIASIAFVGYGLAALVIGVEHKWIKYKKAKERAEKTLDTFLNHVEGKNGFFYHFINMDTGKREWNCEISIIDTAIFICGAITAGEYFGDKVKEKAEILYRNINWEWYRNPENNYFYMGYKPETGFWGQWDMYAEQTMMYVLGVSSPTFPIDKTWGLTSGVGPKGYCEFSADPCNEMYEKKNDGTVTISGAVGSIVFTPEESIKAMEYYYNTFPKLWGKYGFKDGYNLEGSKPWYAKECIGIDKGIEIIMIENYLYGTIWNYFMRNSYVKNGLEKLGFTSKEKLNAKNL